MMGFSTWGEDSSELEYLKECRSSSKYKTGIWYVLDIGSDLVSSLIVYESGFNLPEESVGIGSVATPERHRNKGYASELVKEVTSKYKGMNKEAVYLFSDINPEFYKNLGFKPIEGEQPYKESCCMVNAFNHTQKLTCHAPIYF